MGTRLDFLAMPTISGTWPSLALEATIRVTMALVAASLAVLALRRASASVRHLVWTSGVVGALVMPILMLALPPLSLPVLPGEKSSPRLVDDQLTRPSVPLPLPSPGEPAARIPDFETSRVDAQQSTVAPVPRARRSWETININISPCIVVIWCAGALAVLFPLVVGWFRLRGLARRLAVVELDDLGGAVPRTRRVVLLRGDATASPMTWGVFRPVILVPSGVEGWPRARLMDVLAHELAHVRRWDCLTQLLARVACAVYWFHPLFWLAASRLRVESERACDDLVLRSGSRASVYASHLLEVARGARLAPGLAGLAVPMARPSGLEGRFRAILDPSTSRRVVTRRGAALLFVAIAAILPPLSVARLGAREEPPTDNTKQSSLMTVSGVVRDPEGNPLPGANVAVVGRRKLTTMNPRSEPQHRVLGQGRADARGRFAIQTPRTSSVTYYEAQILANANGFGRGWAELNRDAESPSADVRLRVEQPIEGRLVDLQGEPASGVKIRVSSIGVEKTNVGGYDGMSFWRETPDGLKDSWPASIVTDADGRFRLAGIGTGVNVGLDVEDLRFARQALEIKADAENGPKKVTLSLRPALRVSGRVTRADTGEPIVGALVMVGAGANHFSSGGHEFKTDAEGRYEANPGPGKFLKVTVYPPADSPYLTFERNFEGNEGEVTRQVDMAVPRGVLLTGKITERGTGRPLAGAAVFYENGEGNIVEKEGTIPGWFSAVTSDASGRYALAVTPGKGQLLVYGPTSDFVHEVRGSRAFRSGKPGGKRYYAHAFLPYEVKSGQRPIENDLALNPGVTLAGRVEGPEGQTVTRAEIITTLNISPFHTHWRGDFTVPVRDGRFELHGLPPDRAVKCSFLDARNGWGTTLELSAAMAAKGPLTIRLQPSGSATARIVDAQGKPMAKGVLSLQIVATPGPGMTFGDEPVTEEERAMLMADEDLYVNVDRVNYWEGPRSDAEGRIKLPRLIPGATYRIYEYHPEKGTDAHRWRDFTVEAGKTTDLGDVVMKSDDR